MTLSIIIVSWNVRPILEECLRSIFQNTKNLDFEVFVVDNASTDGSDEFLKRIAKNKSNFHCIFNKKNLGFAKANNQALKLSRGKYILFLNPDTVIYRNTLEKAVNSLKKHPKWGIVGCQLIDIEGKIQPSVRPFPTFFSMFSILLKLHRFLPFLPRWKHYFGLDFDYSKAGPAEQVMGAFLMTKRKVIEEVGGFDEKFYLWFEEVDFCRRVKQAGWEIYYIPEARILHYGGRSFAKRMPLDKQRIYNKSALYYAQKHFPKFYYYLLKFISPLSLFLAFLVEKMFY